MQGGNDAVHLAVDGAALGGRHAGQGLVRQHAAVQEIHQKKRRADDAGVFAVGQHLGHRHGRALQGLHDAVLAVDGMGPRQQCARGLFAQHVVPAAGGELEGRVGAVLASPSSDGSGRVLRLNVSMSPRARIEEQSVFVDHPVAAVRTHPIKVLPRGMVRIRVKVRMPRSQQPGAGGLVIEDSLGGPALAFRRTDAIPEWSEVILYRRASNEGTMTVTLGLAGDGDLFFDDLRVERLTENGPLNPNRIATRDGEAATPAEATGIGAEVAAPAEETVQP